MDTEITDKRYDIVIIFAIWYESKSFSIVILSVSIGGNQFLII